MDTTSNEVPDNSKKSIRKRIKLALFLLVGLLILVFLLTPLALAYLNLRSSAADGIDYIAFQEIGNEANQTLLINKILSWEKENMIDLNVKENEKYPCVRIPYANNLFLQERFWISLTRCGKCGEFSLLFSEIAKKFGIETLVITADNINGGNHAWVEVINDNETIPVETTDINGFNSSEFYKCKWLIQYRNIIDETGKDVSKDYYNRCS